MYGILFHTGTSGSEGTLGGLVESGRRIGEHLLAALEEAQLCSNDPVCAATSPIAPSMRRLCRAKRQLTGKTNPTHRPQGNRIHSIMTRPQRAAGATIHGTQPVDGSHRAFPLDQGIERRRSNTVPPHLCR
jgi:hypothetical protein